jgi:hypothetical protein
MGNSNGKVDPIESVQKSSPSIFSQQNFPNINSNNDVFFKLFVLNTYLIPSLGINVKHTIACRQQKERAEAIGKLIAKNKPEIVCLMEVWGAGMGPLEEQLVASSYEIEECCKSWGGWTIADVVIQRLNQRGGLYVAHLSNNDKNEQQNEKEKQQNESKPSSLQKVPFDKTTDDDGSQWRLYTFENSLKKSKKGCVVTKYSKTRNNGEVAVLYVFTTHLDPSNQDDVQLRQLAELATFVSRTLIAGTETMQNNNEKSSTSLNFSAVIVGDFNFNISSPQFSKMFDIFSSVGGIELDQNFTKNCLDHQTSTYTGIKNPFVYFGAGKKDMGRIDLIFSVLSVGGIPLKNKVEIVAEKVLDDVFVSDHFGFEVVLKC